MKKKTNLKKPLPANTLPADKVEAFIKQSPKAIKGHEAGKPTVTIDKDVKRLRTATSEPKSGLVPDGDVRLSANIDQAIHLKLKIAAAEQRTTIGELIEKLITDNL
jgi:hypothetical protein